MNPLAIYFVGLAAAIGYGAPAVLIVGLAVTTVLAFLRWFANEQLASAQRTLVKAELDRAIAYYGSDKTVPSPGLTTDDE